MGLVELSQHQSISERPSLPNCCAQPKSKVLKTPAHDHRKTKLRSRVAHPLLVYFPPNAVAPKAGKLSSSNPSSTPAQKPKELTAISFFAILHASPNPTTKGAGTVPLLNPRSCPPPLRIGSSLTRGLRRT